MRKLTASFFLTYIPLYKRITPNSLLYMYFDLFKDLRGELAAHYGLNIEEPSGTVINPSPDSIPLRDIQFFNNQFARTIAIAPLVLIDFGNLEFSEITKGYWAAPLKVRFYVVSDSISMSDGQRHDRDASSLEGKRHLAGVAHASFPVFQFLFGGIGKPTVKRRVGY